MTQRPTVMETKRILVALDTSARGRAALEAAVRLAMTTSAELQGLFVEDEDLIRLASLPFACEVDLASASPHRLQSVNMERALRAAAREAEQAFTNALQQHSLKWTFRIVRGTLIGASLAAADDVDTLVIGQQGRSSRLMPSDQLPRRSVPKQSVVAVFDGSASAYRMIEVANELAKSNSGELSILVLSDNGQHRADTCMAWLRRQGIRAEVNQAIASPSQAIVNYVRTFAPGLLLINRDSEFLGESQISEIVNEFECPLILC